MDDFKIDARKWRFLDRPKKYMERGETGLQLEPLARQFKTAKEILTRLSEGRGVLLADDVGLGKTTVGALVAWVVACQDKRVRIYAPNEVLRRRWAEELARHAPLLDALGADAGRRVRQGEVPKLTAGQIQVATHHALVRSHDNNEQRTACDLMIIDEAHRAKGEGSAFNVALRELGGHAKRKLILTATPFSIRLRELEQLLEFAGATEFEAVRTYARRLTELYSLGQGHDVDRAAQALVEAASAAVEALRPFVIRHGVEDLVSSERRHFGEVAAQPWEVPTAAATGAELALLLRVDRVLQLIPERKGERRNDPRFHIGWEHLDTELQRAADRAYSKDGTHDPIVVRHLEAATSALRELRGKPHPKIAAVCDAIRPVLDAGEKVLVFCHHRATASELLATLEDALRAPTGAASGPEERVWRDAWAAVLPDRSPLDLTHTIRDWLCSRGLRAQLTAWIGAPAPDARGLAKQLTTTRPRNAKARVPTIRDAAVALQAALLAKESTSTVAVLKSIAQSKRVFGGQAAHFPGRLDDGYRTMGAWLHSSHRAPPKTLYTGQPDIVLALFNSPFGPDVLIATDRLSEGVDLHRACRHLVHYELDPSPVRTLQRNGRVRRVDSWAALTDAPICYAYPTFGGTRDEKAVRVMRQRIDAFGLLLGGVPSLEEHDTDSEQSFAERVLARTRGALAQLNRSLAV